MERRQDVEILRLLSAFGIVWFHSQIPPGHNLAHSGLIVFIILSMYLGNEEKLSIKTAVQKRFTRLMVPWIIWFTLYGLMNSLKGVNYFPEHNRMLEFILTGPSIHLWYLPFIFLCLLIFDIARKHLNATAIGYFSGIAVVTILSTVPLWQPKSIALGAPYEQYAHAITSVFFGLYIRYFFSLNRFFSATLFALMLLAVLKLSNYESIFIPYLIGLLTGCFLLSNPINFIFNPKLISISKYTFGIYLIHGISLKLAAKIGLSYEFLIPIGAFFISLLAVYLIDKLLPKISRYMF